MELVEALEQRVAQHGMRVYAPNEVDVDFEEELGTGARGVVYEARLRPSDQLVAVKVYHALFKYEDVLRGLVQYFAAIKKCVPLSLRTTLVVPVGILRLPYGQKQTALVLRRANTTLDRAMHAHHRSIVPLLRHVSTVATLAEAVHAEELQHHIPRDQGIAHREVKPCDILLYSTHDDSAGGINGATHPPADVDGVGGGADHMQCQWFPGLPLPQTCIGVPPTRFTDPVLLSTSPPRVADADADVFSIAILLWEVIERRDAPALTMGELPTPSNELVPRELKVCIALAVAARKEKRCAIAALCAELRYCIRAMAQRETEDTEYRVRMSHQAALKLRVYDILSEAIQQIQDVYAEASRAGVAYAVEAQSASHGGNVRLAVGASAASIDVQFRTSSFETKSAWEFAPPLNVYKSTVEESDPQLRRLPPTVAFTEALPAVETVDLSDGVPSPTAKAVRVSNYRQLAYTPSLEYPEQVAEGFLCGYTSLLYVDLTALRPHVRKVGDFFLYGCSSIQQLSLDAFEDVTVVGFAFLAGCRGLTSLDVRAFSNVQSVGGDFLHNCTALEELDLAPLVNAVDVSPQSRFLNGCMSLRRLKLPRSIPIECVDVHRGQWVEENDRWWEFTSGERTYFIPRLEPTGGDAD